MKSLRTARTALPAALAVGALVLTGCGTSDPDNAAVVGGETISVQEVQSATSQLAAAGATPSSALRILILGHFAEKEASAVGKGVSLDQARTFAKQQLKISDPNPATLELLRRSLATQVIGQDGKAAQRFLDELRKADITVNPRFGTFDAKTGDIKDTTPDWIKPAPTPAPAAPVPNGHPSPANP